MIFQKKKKKKELPFPVYVYLGLPRGRFEFTLGFVYYSKHNCIKNIKQTNSWASKSWYANLASLDRKDCLIDNAADSGRIFRWAYDSELHESFIMLPRNIGIL